MVLVIRFYNAGKPLRLLAALSLLVISSLVGPLVRSGNAQSMSRPANPYGVNVFLHKEVEQAKIERTLQMIAQANIPWVKQEFPWQELEFKKNYFHDDKWNKSSWEKYDVIVNLAQKYNLNIIARIDHPPDWARSGGGAAPLKDNQDLADFINEFLDHYSGKIKYVQVWNEPNLAAEWVPGTAVDPANYAMMLKTVYTQVKEQHPEAIILSAPMAMTLEGPSLRGNMNEIDYWTGLYAAGVKGFFDVASANGYGLDQPPDAPPDPRVLNFRRVELLRDVMVKNGDSTRPIWFDEYAWNASPETLSDAEKNYWRHVTPEQQAQWTVQGIEYARKNWPWAGVISIWYFRQVGDIPPEKAEYYFAMVNPDFSTQPIYDAVKSDAMNYPGPVSAGNQQPEATATPNAPSSTATTAPPPPSPTSVPPTNTAIPATPTPQVTPSHTATPIVTPTATSSPTVVTITATATATVTAVVESTSTGSGGPNIGLYIIGIVLIGAGLAGLGLYFMRSRAGE